MIVLAFVVGFVVCFILMVFLPLIGLNLEKIQAMAIKKRGLKLLAERDKILLEIDKIYGQLENGKENG